MTDIHSDKILILDFGAQYTQLIARRIREIGVYCEIWPWDHDPAEIAAFGAEGHHPLGRPGIDHAGRRAARAAGVFERRAGARHLLRHADHGRAARRRDRSCRRSASSATPRSTSSRQDALFDGLKRSRRRAAASRRVDEPRRSRRGAAGLHRHRADRPHPGRRDGRRGTRWYGVQFHPEVTHTKQGAALLAASCVDICGCGTLWTAANIIDDPIARVRAQVGDDDVLLGLSGGVDSSVVAALLHKAIGDRLTCVFVDTACCAGRRRPGDGDVRRAHGVKVIRVDAARALLRRARRRRRPGSEAQDHRQPVHRGVRRGGAASWTTRSGWRRARSTRT